MKDVALLENIPLKDIASTRRLNSGRGYHPFLTAHPVIVAVDRDACGECFSSWVYYSMGRLPFIPNDSCSRRGRGGHF